MDCNNAFIKNSHEHNEIIMFLFSTFFVRSRTHSPIMAANDKDKEEFMHDWYAILGCDKSSAKEGIEKAARKLAVKYHPDKTSDPEAPEKFLLVQKAKEILLDDAKRKIIDDHKDAIQKRQVYEAQKNSSMDARRKRMRDEFNDRLSKANSRTPSEAEIFQNELSKRSKIIDDLRKKNKDLMEQSREEANYKEHQQAKDFMNYRKSVIESTPEGCCQVKVKWRRTSESHSDDSLYQIFKPFGSIEDAVLAGSKGTSGLVTFTDAASALRAVEHFKSSEDYRVSLLTEATGGLSSTDSRGPSANSELSGDIRRAVEKNNLLNIIGKLKRPTSLSSLHGGGSTFDEQPPSDTPATESANVRSNISAPVVTAATLASKENDVLQKMLEIARRKKLALAESSQQAT